MTFSGADPYGERGIKALKIFWLSYTFVL